MKEKRQVNTILYIILLFSLIAFEIHIYPYYSYFQILLFLLLLLASSIILRDRAYLNEFEYNLKKNIVIIPLVFMMLFSSIISIILFSYAAIQSILTVILYIINIIILFVLLPIYFKNNKRFTCNFINVYIIVIIPIILFGIILYFNNGILGYYLEGKRSGSIYFDSNFFAIISALPCILVFMTRKKRIFKYLIFIISLLGVFVSGSRGTMLSLVLCIVYYIFIKYPNKKLLKKIFLIASIIVVAMIFFSNLNNIPFLRLDQGSHGRSELIMYALSKLSDSPIFGFGFGSIAKILQSANFSNSNTHNSLVDYAFRYGYPATIMYIYVIMKSWLKSFNSQRKMYINLLLILLFINMNTILYSFGGVGLPSMALTLCMGIACYENRSDSYEKT